MDLTHKVATSFLIKVLVLTQTPGRKRGLGNHTQMHVKKIGMSFHQGLTWEIRLLGILMTSAPGALGGELQEGVAMTCPLLMALMIVKDPVMDPLIRS